MLRRYSLELRSYGVILVVGTVSLLLTSSFGAIEPNISSRLKDISLRSEEEGTKADVKHA